MGSMGKTSWMFLAAVVLLAWVVVTPVANTAGVDRINLEGAGWNTSSISTGGPYVGIASEYAAPSWVPTYAAILADGGVDRITWNWPPGWVTGQISSGGPYVAIANEPKSWIAYAAVLADGGVDRISWGAGWETSRISSGGPYAGIAAESSPSIAYAAILADGGVDRITWDPGWNTSRISSGGPYVGITCEPKPYIAYAAVLADGGVDRISWGTGWETSRISSGGPYAGIAAELSGDIAYAAILGNGGVDRIAWMGSGWNTSSISSGGPYSAIAASRQTGIGYVAVVDGTAPEVDCALIQVDGPGRSANNMPAAAANFRRVEFSASDNCGVAAVTASIDGIAVSDGNLVKISIDPAQPAGKVSEGPKGYIHIIGPTGVLTVTATDESGNAGTCTATP